MTQRGLPDPSTPFGERVLRRLREEQVIWIVTVGNDGTPQPNPVGFVFDDDGSILIYNAATAHRLDHIVDRPRVALHFDGDGAGGDIVVFTGTASVATDAPPPHENPAFVAKYGDGMTQISGSPERFSGAFPTPLRVDITRTRGR
jgi:PPOX class probable F420-dependent enzyme